MLDEKSQRILNALARLCIDADTQPMGPLRLALPAAFKRKEQEFVEYLRSSGHDLEAESYESLLIYEISTIQETEAEAEITRLTEQTKQAAERWIAAWRSQRLFDILHLFAKDGVYRNDRLDIVAQGHRELRNAIGQVLHRYGAVVIPPEAPNIKKDTMHMLWSRFVRIDPPYSRSLKKCRVETVCVFKSELVTKCNEDCLPVLDSPLETF